LASKNSPLGNGARGGRRCRRRVAPVDPSKKRPNQQNLAWSVNGFDFQRQDSPLLPLGQADEFDNQSILWVSVLRTRDGTSQDCNGNGVPDKCEPSEDCNGNGRADICDIGWGYSTDCNANTVPDECDTSPGGGSEDCNSNKVPDSCEINIPSFNRGSQKCEAAIFTDRDRVYEGSTSGVDVSAFVCQGFQRQSASQWFRYTPATSGSCSISLCESDPQFDTVLMIYRSCKDADNAAPWLCNDDDCGIHSAVLFPAEAFTHYFIRVAGFDASSSGHFHLRIAGPEGMAEDCNENQIPDSCDVDVARCGSAEWCKDCNHNGWPDQCDFWNGGDLDGDGKLDECPRDCHIDDESNHLDCDHNHVLDECEILWNDELDCDGNGILDQCEEPRPDVWWRGGVGKWDDETMWCPERVPNQPSQYESVEVSVGRMSEGVVTLDISPLIKALTIKESFWVEVNTASGSVHTLAVEDEIHNEGTLRASAGHRLVIDTDSVVQGTTGVIEAIGPGSIVQINGGGVKRGTIRTSGAGAAVELLGGAVLDGVTIQGPGQGASADERSTLAIPDRQSGVVRGPINNSGLIQLGVGVPDAVYGSRLSPAGDNAILNGSGVLAMKSSVSEFGGFTGTFANGRGHTIRGVGVIFGNFENACGAVVRSELDDPAGGQLILYPPGTKTNAGEIRAASAPLVVATDLENMGTIIVEGTLEAPGAITIYAGALEALSGSTSRLTDLRVDGSSLEVLCSGGFGPCTGVGEAAVLGGWTPPKLRVEPGADVTLVASVAFVGRTEVAAAGASIDLSGDWINHSDCPSRFDTASTELRVGGVDQTFEVAGRDLCTCPALFLDVSDDNFAMGTIEVLPGATVRFQDLFPNNPSEPPRCGEEQCGEAQYVRWLVLGSGSRLIVDNCRMYYYELQNFGGTIEELGCGMAQPMAHGESSLGGSLELADWAAIERCLRGPQGSLTRNLCECLDVEGDGDVDLSDVARYLVLPRK